MPRHLLILLCSFDIVIISIHCRPLSTTSGYETAGERHLTGNAISSSGAIFPSSASENKDASLPSLIITFKAGLLEKQTAELLRHLQAGISVAAAAATAVDEQQQLFSATRLDGGGVVAGAADTVAAAAADRAPPPAAGALQGIVLTAAAHLPQQLVLELARSFPATHIAVPDRVVSAQVVTGAGVNSACVPPQSLSSGVLVAKPSKAFKWPTCLTAKTQLRWMGQRAGGDLSQVQWTAVVAVSKSSGAVVKGKGGQPCILQLDASKPASWNAVRFGSPAAAPAYAAGQLPSLVCSADSAGAGSSASSCLQAASVGTGAGSSSTSIVQQVAQRTPVLCNGKLVQSLQLSGEPCGPDSKFIIWQSATSPDGCTLQRSSSPLQLQFNANVFGFCGQPPANAAADLPVELCPTATGSGQDPDTSEPQPSNPPPSPTLNTLTDAASETPEQGDAAADKAIEGPRLLRVAVAKGEQVPTGVERIRAARQGAVASTAGLPLELQTVVAVADSGVDSTHPDLNYIGGMSFVDVAPDSPDDAPDPGVDRFGHGTHVAGVAAARNDGAGVVGVSPGTPIFSLKVLDGSGNGKLSKVLAAISYVLDNADSLRIKVINLSLSTFVSPKSSPADYSDYTQLVCGLLKRVSDRGIVVVAASGNYGADLRSYFPAVCPTVVAVTATEGPAAASFSNYLPADALQSDKDTLLAAPGTWIYSTMSFAKDPSGYKSLSGTSMAAPHVAGVFCNCIASGACSNTMTGEEKLALVRKDALAKLALSPGFGFKGDLAPADGSQNGKVFGPLVWSKY